VQIMYGIAGERMLAEREIKSLSGYENSSPVRIGNAASEQFQLDLYGEVLDAFFCAYCKLEHFSAEDFALLRLLVEHLETVWEKPDNGIWEVRGGLQHFTYSKVMAWVAFDRAIKIAESDKLDAPFERWKKTREVIHKQVCEKAFNKQLNSFVQHYGSHQLDASVLLMAMVGFLPPEDPRIHGTVEAIERHLTQDGLVMRYDTSRTEDGLTGGEGKFLACSFWLVSNLRAVPELLYLVSTVLKPSGCILRRDGRNGLRYGFIESLRGASLCRTQELFDLRPSFFNGIEVG